MPSALRSRLALLLMLGAFLIPIGMSSLRGLTHVLTCQEEAETPFTLLIETQGAPTLLTSQFIEKEDEPTLCGGLELNMGARAGEDDEIEMILPIHNASDFVWQGSVKLVIGDTAVPVPIGRISPGDTEEAIVDLPSLPSGRATEVNGSLLIGP